jgi:phage terminase large subunit-like protein
MEKLHKKADEFWVVAARHNILIFIFYVFGFLTEIFHRGWLKQFFSESNPNQVIVAPRGSGKTVYLSIALLYFMSRYPWASNVLLSVSTRQARERLQFIREALEYDRYQRVFPWIKIDPHRPDTQDQFTIYDSRMDYKKWRSDIVRMGGDFKSPTLYVAGAGGRGVVGSRVSNGVLALDDIADEQNSRTSYLRDQLYAWLSSTVLPIRTGPGCRIWSIGTRWADDDILARQIESGEFEHSEVKAIIRDEGNKLRSYWPAWWPFKKLLTELNIGGRVSFVLSYLNNVTALNGAIFTADMLRKDFPRTEEGDPVFPVFEKIIVSADAAVKAKEASDESSIGIIGINTNPNTKLPRAWVLKMYTGHWGNMEVIEQLESAWNTALSNYRADEYSVLFETVAGQQVFLSLMEQKEDFSIPMSLIDTYSPIVDKGTRAQSTTAAGERGDLLIDVTASWYPKLFSQCIEFTGEKGNADDMVDVIVQVGVREFGDIGSYVRHDANTTVAVIPGLSL